MQKGTLQGNILPKAKQRFVVTGLTPCIVITRDEIEVAVGAIELPDGTKTSGGRVEPGEFGVTLQFGDDVARRTYINWFNEAKDRGASGVSPNYKRSATLTFLRSFSDPPDITSSSGSDLEKVEAIIRGVWCLSYTIPEGDIDATDGDGYTTLSCNLSYDDAEVII